MPVLEHKFIRQVRPTFGLWFFILLVSLSGCLKKPVEAPSITDAEITTNQPMPANFILASATGGDGSITMFWNLSEHAARYSIHYRPITSNTFIEASSSANSPYTITGLTNGLSYQVKVTAINGTGERDSNILQTATQSISAIIPSLSYVTAPGTAGTLNNAMYVAPTTLLGNGSVITNCIIAPALPTGLTINPSNCVISGTPTIISGATIYNVTAINGVGSSAVANVTLSVSALAPSLSYALSSGTLGTENQAMSVTPSLLVTNGAAITNCTIAPALPAGLTIDTSTCVISGTPTTSLPSTAYSVVATNSAGSSPITFVNLSVVPACPAGMVGIPGSAIMGTDHFCVMQYEAKCNGASCPTQIASATALPVSQATGLPWVSLSMQQAKAACLQLGFQYDLVSNAEWMTIARHVEAIPQNWSSGSVNSGCLYRGNVGFTDSCSYNGLDPEAGVGRNAKASLRLASGSRIWDFSGNVWEWTDWNLASGLQTGPTSCASVTNELTNVNCPAIASAQFRPSNVALTSSNGIGLFFGGSGGAAMRGGNWSSGQSAGPFALFLANSITSAGSPFGFRCVYRPNTTPSVPVVSYLGSSGTTVSIGSSMSVVPTTLASNGSPISNCTTAPALPAGLSIDVNTCVISGTPSVSVTNITYFVTATNGTGLSTAAPVTLTTSAQIPNLSYVGSAGTVGTVGVAMSVTPTTLSNNGAAITACTSTPSLPVGLSLNPTTCVISGTPVSFLSESTFSIRAQNSVGQSTAALVNLSATSLPVISYLGSSGTNALVGQAISVSPTTMSSIGSILSCATTPALPAGLSINANTCVISGTAATPFSSSFDVVATNAIGASAPASVTLTLNANAPQLSYVGSTGTTVLSATPMNVVPTLLNDNGTPLSFCGIRVPTLPLPAWAAVNPSTCAITGTPTTSLPSTVYTLRASNAAGHSADALVTLRVNANVPTLSFVGSTGTLGVVGNPMSVAPTTLQNNGSAITFCTVSPALPAGLTLNTSTCVISGTPSTVFASTTFALRATNGIGQSAIANVDLLTSPSAPTLSYAGATGTTGVVGSLMLISPTAINNNGAAITNCTVAPALPAGLTLNTTNCSITGTPVALLASTAFTVTAVNSEGSSPGAVVNIRVIATPTLSFAGALGTNGVAGTAMSVTPTTLLDNGSAISLCSVSPALPTGLAINPLTCVISGTPSAVLVATNFNVTAYNTAGAGAVAVVNLSVAAGVPTISFAGTLGTNGTVGVPMNVVPTTLNNNGAAITNCTVAPALPAGLSLNSTTCVISGTPAGAIVATAFAVTAINSQGSSVAANVTLSTGASVPTISFAGSTGTSAAVGVIRSITPTTLANNGSPVTNCTTTPTLPAGLSISPTTCVISGTVAITFSTAFSVTAINGAGSSIATGVTLVSVANVPTVSFAGSTGTTGTAGQAMSVTPTTLLTNGAVITNCTSAPALPAGLTLNTSTCVITGTSNTTQASTPYTITATNSAGASVGAVVNLTIDPGVPHISYLAATGTSGAVGVPMSVLPTTLHTNGAAITNCVIAPALPAGLSINTTTCEISGTPIASVSATSYSVTASNAQGNSTAASVVISTAVTAPILSYSGATGTFGNLAVLMSVSPTTLNNNGSAITACAIRPPTTALPVWAAVDPLTCVISGTPNAPLAPTLYTLIASNIAGDSADATVTLSVGASAPSISFVGSTGTTGSVGTPMSVTPTTLNNNGATITNCVSVPALPAGLTINTTTCVISGTPTLTSVATGYFITATNSAGNSTAASVTLTVTAGLPVISFAGSTGTAGTIDSPMSVTPTTLTTNGAAISGCSVTPSLPSGLSLNTSTCVISGTPTVSHVASVFQVTATNAMGSSIAANVTLSVAAIAPILSYVGSTGTSGQVNSAMIVTPTNLDANGSAINNCTITPVLPLGLSINTTTCVISGTPLVTAVSANYTVTATNGIGSSPGAIVNLTVNAAIPTLSYSGSAGTNGQVGVAMSVTPSTITPNGAAITNCVASPALPGGLTISATTCVISGTPGATIAPTIFNITATNSAGTSNPATVTLSTGVNVPTISYAGSSGTTGNVGVPMNIAPTTFAGNGATVTNCSSSPALPAGLALNASTCVISGTPSTILGSTSFSITATNSAGNSTAAVVNLNIAAGVPILSFVGASGTNGQVGIAMSVMPTTLQTNGAAISNCTVTPGLPTGLALNPTSCVVSGTPTGTITPTIYSVTAVNSAGSSTAALVTLSTGVNVPTLSFAGATGTTGVVGQAMSVTPTLLSANGASVTNCQSTPALPAGLTINPTNCHISGTPTATLVSTSYIIVASNSAGDSVGANVNLIINAGAPFISYAGAIGTNGQVAVAMSVLPTTLTNNGAAVTNCTVAPSLPTGLSLNTTTCVISGTPTGAIAPTVYSVTAINSAGSSIAALVTLSTGVHPPSLSYAGASGTVGVVNTLMSVTPTNLATNGAALSNCAISPALPAGLTINATNCVISGTPSATLGNTSYTVTPTNSAGAGATASVTLQITAGIPSLSFLGSTGTNGAVGVPMSITPTSLVANGAAISACSVDPTLPDALTINATTCVISGTPSLAVAPTIYNVRATNSAGVSNAAMVNISTGAHPPSLSFAGSTGTTGLVGTAMSIAPTLLADNGSVITNCSIAPALPAGLSINTSTCLISGTPTTVSNASYTVTLTNAEGTDDATVSLIVNANTPVLSFVAATGTNGDVGSPMTVTPTTLNPRGAAISNCAISPTLPAPLTINSTTCVISGTPGAPIVATVFSVVATNSAGNSSIATVTLSTGGNIPTLSYAGAAGTTGQMGQAMSVTPTTLNDNGAAVFSCGIKIPTTALPAWANVNFNTCVISGTPNALLGATVYTLVATNLVGTSADATVTLTVNAGPPTLSFAAATGTTGSIGQLMTVTPTTLTTNGSAITNCSVAPALPAGLTLNSTSCVISGTPVGNMAATPYTVTATNAIGASAGAIVTLTVASAPVLSYAGAIGTTVDAGTLMTVTPTTLTDGGTAITSCSSTPALPAGISINASTCVISGVAAGTSGPTVYSITASNVVGAAPAADVTLTFENGPPTLSYAGAPGTAGTVGVPMTITPTTFTDNGDAITDCQSTPALPAGLTLDDVTCVISGTPTDEVPGDSFTIVASNSNGDSLGAVVTLTTVGCPDGYVIVAGDATLGTDSFCVMQYEAKCSGASCPTTAHGPDASPISEEEGEPWVLTTLNAAKSACRSLGYQYDLISNEEWMTVARNVETRSSNWPSGVVGTGCINRGNVGLTDACSYNAGVVEFDGGRDNKARLQLLNGLFIWDLSGNVAEWIDWSANSGLDLAPTTCTSDPAGDELWNVTCLELDDDDYLPDGNYDSTNGVGMFYAGPGGAAIRGGSFSGEDFAGLYSLDIYEPATFNDEEVGFRCVWRPNADPEIPTLSYQGVTGTSGAPETLMTVTPTLLITNGAAITDCDISPALPAGLSINDNTCVISGTPTEASASTEYTIIATNSVGPSAPATVNISVATCPTGFLPVPANAVVGTSNFCVMDHEAKCDGIDCPTSTAGPDALPISEPDGSPWTNLTIVQAKAACEELGSRFDLISNPEWITIARNAEGVGLNWSSGIVNSGCLFRGNVGMTDACSYNFGATHFGFGRDSRASLRLSNSSVIWDISGNVSEWVDWAMTPGLQLGPATCTSAPTGDELPDVSCVALSATDYLPTTPSLVSTNGVGMFYATADSAVTRGGASDFADFAGAFTLEFASTTATSDFGIGFRCVWRPD